MSRIGVLGAGSWGTALAIHSAKAGCEVLQWARDPGLARRMQSERCNEKYLPDFEFPSEVMVTSHLEDLADCRVVLAVVPSHGFREVLGKYLEVAALGKRTVIVSCTKGIEGESLGRMSDVTRAESERTGREVDFAVLSGPTFAAELAAESPSAAVIASENLELAADLCQQLATARMRLYSTRDVVGVELGGAGKNVIAIGAGIVSGLGLGHNTLAALITRGLHEIARLGVACGGERKTFSGLAGLGDLVLTCTGGLSRNRRTGMELATGKTLEQIQRETSMVAEGVRNSITLTHLARQRGVEMPITEQMMALMYEGKSPQETVEELMTRELKSESRL